MYMEKSEECQVILCASFWPNKKKSILKIVSNKAQKCCLKHDKNFVKSCQFRCVFWLVK